MFNPLRKLAVFFKSFLLLLLRQKQQNHWGPQNSHPLYLFCWLRSVTGKILRSSVHGTLVKRIALPALALLLPPLGYGSSSRYPFAGSNMRGPRKNPSTPESQAVFQPKVGSPRRGFPLCSPACPPPAQVPPREQAARNSSQLKETACLALDNQPSKIFHSRALKVLSQRPSNSAFPPRSSSPAQVCSR